MMTVPLVWSLATPRRPEQSKKGMKHAFAAENLSRLAPGQAAWVRSDDGFGNYCCVEVVEFTEESLTVRSPRCGRLTVPLDESIHGATSTSDQLLAPSSFKLVLPAAAS
jgi:hypothetical protein